MTYTKYGIIALLAIAAVSVPIAAEAMITTWIGVDCDVQKGKWIATCHDINNINSQVVNNTSVVLINSQDIAQNTVDSAVNKIDIATNSLNIEQFDDRLFLMEYLSENDVTVSAAIVVNGGNHYVNVTVSGFTPGDTIEWDNKLTTSCLGGSGVMPLDGSNLNISSLRTIELCGIPVGDTIDIDVYDISVINPSTSNPLTLFTQVTYNP